MLADVDNGYPTFMAEMTLLTALRTAATSAMIAKHLARPDSEVMALIGAGSQAEFRRHWRSARCWASKHCVYDVDQTAVDRLPAQPGTAGVHHSVGAERR